MSYQPLARKYRPQKFSDLVGQDTAALALTNAIKLGRPSPAIIFTGVRGVGKTTTARLYAKALNCDNGPTPEPCGVCGSCEAISLGTHQDVLEIDGASNNGVDEVRELQETLEYVPQRSPFKVYIIDEVHMLTQSAFNALLKTLEEPPARVVFVFATTEINRVPKTILSRCQTFHLQKIPQETVHKRLAEILTREGIPFAEDALRVIAREGKGSMRDALTLLDQAIAQGSGRVERDVVDAICPSHASLQLMDLLEAVVQKRAADIIALVDACDQAGLTMAQLTEELARMARMAFIVRDIGTDAVAAQFLTLDQAEMAKLKALAGQAKPLELNRIFRFLVQCRHDLDGSELDRFVVENYALEWCLDPGLPDLGQWIGGNGDATPRTEGMRTGGAPAGGQAVRAGASASPFAGAPAADGANAGAAGGARSGGQSLRQIFQSNVKDGKGTSPGATSVEAAAAPAPETPWGHAPGSAAPRASSATGEATMTGSPAGSRATVDGAVNAPRGTFGSRETLAANASGHSAHSPAGGPFAPQAAAASAIATPTPRDATPGPAADAHLASALAATSAPAPREAAPGPAVGSFHATDSASAAAMARATNPGATSAATAAKPLRPWMLPATPKDPSAEGDAASPEPAASANGAVAAKAPEAAVQTATSNSPEAATQTATAKAPASQASAPTLPWETEDENPAPPAAKTSGAATRPEDVPPWETLPEMPRGEPTAKARDAAQAAAPAPTSGERRADASAQAATPVSNGDEPQADASVPPAQAPAPRIASASPGAAGDAAANAAARATPKPPLPASASSSAPSAASVPAAAAQAVPGVLPETWRGLVDAWKAQKPMMARILEEAYLVEYGPAKIVLATKNDSLAAQKLLQADVQKKIAEQFAILFGFTGAFQVIAYSPELAIKASPVHAQAEPAEAPAAQNHQTLLDIRRDENRQKREALIEDVRNHPLTLEALARFGGRIETIEIVD